MRECTPSWKFRLREVEKKSSLGSGCKRFPVTCPPTAMELLVGRTRCANDHNLVLHVSIGVGYLSPSFVVSALRQDFLLGEMVYSDDLQALRAGKRSSTSPTHLNVISIKQRVAMELSHQIRWWIV
jgi:hypothetical protein